jgi:hypothetical protein
MAGQPSAFERELHVHALMLQAAYLLTWGMVGGDRRTPVCGMAPPEAPRMGAHAEEVLVQAEAQLKSLEVRFECSWGHGLACKSSRSV